MRLAAGRRLARAAHHIAPALSTYGAALHAAGGGGWQPPLQHEPPDEEEWALRLELAVAYRWADRHQLSEGVCNHFTAEVRRGEYLVIPYGMQWAEVTAASLLLIDERGAVLRGGGPELPRAQQIMARAEQAPDAYDESGLLEPTAFYIHGAIHKLLGDRAKVVLHTHMPYATALACTTAQPGAPGPPPNRLAYVHQSASRFWSRVVYEDRFGGLVMDDEEGVAFARLLEELPPAETELSVLFLANHGVLVCAPTVAMAYDSLYYLERTCMFQVNALQAMGPHGQLQRISDEQMDALHAQKMRVVGFQAEKHFGALRRVMEKEEPEFAQSWAEEYAGC